MLVSNYSKQGYTHIPNVTVLKTDSFIPKHLCCRIKGVLKQIIKAMWQLNFSSFFAQVKLIPRHRIKGGSQNINRGITIT